MQTKSGLNPAGFSGKVDGQDVQMYILTNSKGAEATVINYGAKIVSLSVPDKNGNLVDVVLGHNNLDEYLSSEEPYFGAVCGRTGNRIAKGKFVLDGVTYQLAINNGPNNLHGGLKGFNAVVWTAKQLDSQTLELTYLSKDGEEGFPGSLNVKIVYKLTDENAFEITYEATTDKATILNLTNHSYFNLSGEGDPSVNDHSLVMHASTYLPTDDTAIPYGKPEDVKGTPFDFLTAHTIGERIDDDFEQLHFGKGYDHTFVLDKKDGEYALAVECSSPKTGIEMKVYTTEPGVQVYTGNWMSGNFEGKHGHRYPARAAVCFETQHFPDSINKPEYPSVVLRPEDTFKSKTVFAFSVK
ncbi:aldose epimerase family protein [Dysgonomonas sp. Marseille-P4361]|uniref:aldose epimerase family protein n=1 Tax=Dysgonomonas sp. Marseille-P4361 TaxID=2161820 RepID=UPI000D5628D9|nr:aldose epimerase family protein [Dysgonomonas sp. Marseille-P4361]